MYKLKLREAHKNTPLASASKWYVVQLEGLLNDNSERKFTDPKADNLDDLFIWNDQPEGEVFWGMADLLFELQTAVTLRVTVSESDVNRLKESLLAYDSAKVEEI